MATLFIHPFSHACADDKTAAVQPPMLGEQAASSLDALEKANKYTFETGGIAVLIGYGTGNGKGITAEYVGDSFVKEIKRRGWHARYFYYLADWRGMSAEYHIGYSALGPWNVDDAASNISKAVARAKAAQAVHNQ